MTDVLLSLGTETERNVLPTLAQLSENDIDNIWGNVCAFVSRHMVLQRGVHITGLGTFTFSQQKLDMGPKFILIQRPIFLLAEKVAQTHCLKQARPLAPAGDVPVSQLNFTALSVESSYDRDTVEGCVRETILLLQRALSSQSSVNFTFRGIGVLSIRNNKVRMKFYKDFVSSVDGSGKLLWAMSNRCGTSNSLLSGTVSRCHLAVSRSATPLPRIISGGEGTTQEPQEAGKDLGGSGTPPPTDTDQTQTQEQREETPDASRPNTTSRRATLQPAKVNGFSLPDDFDFIPPAETTDRSTPFPLHPGIDVDSRREETYLSRPCKDHSRAGQELCYLCMQRSQRNVPLYLMEERRRAEQEEDRVLLLKEQERIQQYLQKEQASRCVMRENAQKVAAFNLGVTDALKETQPAPYHGSYIFSGRPMTPHRIIKQQGYMLDLQAQAQRTKERNLNSAENRNLLDRLHQAQLAQEKFYNITVCRYKTTSDAVPPPVLKVAEYCSPAIPAYQPDGVVFRQSDCTLAEQRERAEKVFQEQLTTATQKRREELYNHRQKEKMEREMLHRNRKELIEERVGRFEKMRGLRSSLEQTWGRSAELKRQRDREEKSFIRSGDHLLLEQCEQYRRCYQCKRKTSNCGQTNLWKESRYIPGSRLMI
ncbi:coiled-coil domain-containing protein 81-like [Aplochiton taeniatus]